MPKAWPRGGRPQRSFRAMIGGTLGRHRTSHRHAEHRCLGRIRPFGDYRDEPAKLVASIRTAGPFLALPKSSLDHQRMCRTH
jgi:hypothetical protein